MSARRTPWAALLLVLAPFACRSIDPLPPEVIPDTFETHPGPGTPEVWDELWARIQADGRHRAALLERGDDALLLRLNLIRSARRSIRIQTFIWKNDEAGRLVFWELLKAVTQRGVEVEVLVDEAFNQVEPRILAGLAQVDPRLKIRLYNPSDQRIDGGLLHLLQASAWDLRRLNIRMHNKLFLVDDRYAIAGGRNYSNKYYDRVIGLNFKDRDVLVAGPEVQAAAASFREYWEHPWAVPAEDLLDVRAARERGDDHIGRTGTEFAFHGLFTDTLRRAADAYEIRHWLDEHAYAVEGVRFLADQPQKNRRSRPSTGVVPADGVIDLIDGGLSDGGLLTEHLIACITAAQESVVIQSPYLALSERAVGLFRTLRQTRPDLQVTISTNSLAATDSWQTYAYSHKQKRIYLQDLGFQIWEFMPIPQDIHRMMDYGTLLERRPTPDEREEIDEAPFHVDRELRPAWVPDGQGGLREVTDRRNAYTRGVPFLCLHQKSFVVDGRTAVIGSYNFDPRSGNLNTELAFFIEDRDFAQALLREIQRDVAPRNSFRIAEREEPGGIGGLWDLVQQTSESTPVDPWPFRRTASFRLKDGCEPVPPGHPDFFRNWRDVGSFPLLGALSEKVICARLLKTFGAPLSPLVQSAEPSLPLVDPQDRARLVDVVLPAGVLQQPQVAQGTRGGGGAQARRGEDALEGLPAHGALQVTEGLALGHPGQQQ